MEPNEIAEETLGEKTKEVINDTVTNLDLTTFTYPRHVEAFETYYYLGDRRTMKEAARIRFGELYPQIKATSPEYENKFITFYLRVRRWAIKENWKEAVARKDMFERMAREKAMREAIINSQKNLLGYRGIIQQGIFAFSKRAGRSVRMIVKILELEDKLARPDLLPEDRMRVEREIEGLRADFDRNGVQIGSYRELRECINLDVELAKILEELPDAGDGDRAKLGEGTAENIDSIMELLRRKAGELRVHEVDPDEGELPPVPVGEED